MKKLSIILVIAMMLGISAMATGCSGSSSSDKDLFDAGSWDYDGDGKLNKDELKDYGDFYQDAYDYAY